MGLLVSVLQHHTPEVVKKMALAQLFKFTAAAFEADVPRLADLNSEERLARYARFAATQAGQRLQDGRGIDTLERRLCQRRQGPGAAADPRRTGRIARDARRPDLVQFAQRIVVDYHLMPLDRDETRAYIRHRVAVAGGADPLLFDDAACDTVYEHSGGVPRLINLLCDTALVYGFAAQSTRIDAPLVHEVARDKQKGGIFPTFAKTPDESGAAPEAGAGVHGDAASTTARLP